MLCTDPSISHHHILSYLIRFSKSEITISESDITVSSSSETVILFVKFRFPEKKTWIVFQKVLLSYIFDKSRLVFFFTQPTAIVFLFLYFLMIQASFFEKSVFCKYKLFVYLFSYRYAYRVIALHMGHYLFLLPFSKEVYAYLKYLRKRFQKMYNFQHISLQDLFTNLFRIFFTKVFEIYISYFFRFWLWKYCFKNKYNHIMKIWQPYKNSIRFKKIICSSDEMTSMQLGFFEFL